MIPERLRSRLLDLKVRQDAGEPMVCPRCGLDTMKPVAPSNALSRHANIYICPDCGCNEGVLAFMNSPLPLDEWACFQNRLPAVKFPSANGCVDVLRSQHIPHLKALYARWLAESGHGDFGAYRASARKACPGLTDLWEHPFQAVYQCQDGSQAIVRFKSAAKGILTAIDTLPK